MTELVKPPGPLAKLRLLVAAAEDTNVHEADLKVLAVLVDTIGKSGTGWWGFATIGKRIGKHRSVVVRSVARLENLGYVTCHRAGGGSKDNTTRYGLGKAPTRSTDATGSTHATSSVDAQTSSTHAHRPVAPVRHESVRAFESVKQKQSEEEAANADASARPGLELSSEKPKSARTRKPALTFRDWEASMGEGAALIPQTHSVMRYFKRIKIPNALLVMTWKSFVRKNVESGKKQADWPLTFRRCIEGNWYRFWYLSDGEYLLTTVGLQEQQNLAALKAEAEQDELEERQRAQAQQRPQAA